MKNLKVTLTAMMFALFCVMGTNQAKAQTTGDLLFGLLNVNISLVEAAIEIDDITVEDVVDIGDINILNESINNNEVLSRNQKILNNLLRDADIITGNQVVVGILSSGSGFIVYVVDKATTKKAKK